MPRARLLTFILLTSLIAACTASSPTAPTSSPRSQLRANHDDAPPHCDSTTLSGYSTPPGQC